MTSILRFPVRILQFAICNLQLAICNHRLRHAVRRANCAALLLLIAAFSPAADEPVRQYDGRTLDEWRELIKSIDFRSEAAADAVPGLMELVSDERLPWYSRSQAAQTLGRIGRPAVDAVPLLTALLSRPAEPGETSTAAWAAKALSLFGPPAAPATPELVRLLNDTDRTLNERLSAVEALARIGGAHADVIPALMGLARDETAASDEAAQLRVAAVDGLALTGSAAAPAVPMLIRLTAEPTGRLRKQAAVALGAIGPGAGIAAPALAELVLFEELLEVREAAASSLARIGDMGEAALRTLLADEDPAVRRHAAAALGEVLRKLPENAAALTAALDDADAVVRITAAESLWQTTRKADAFLPTVLDTLTAEDRQLRIRAYRLLLALGPAARPALPARQELANDPRPHIRQVAEKALSELPTIGSGN
jgi:HEAT repeat protein